MKAASILVLVLAMVAAPASTQKPAKKEKEWRPASLPAEAIRFGHDLEAASGEGLKKWALEHVRNEMRPAAVDPKAIMAAVDTRFASGSVDLRDAITFLLFYLAYKDEDENQRLLAVRIRDIDRDTIEITRQLQQMWKNDQSRAASPTQASSPNARVANEEQQQRMEAQLREYADERQLKSTQLSGSRKKINAYLKLLDIAHGRMRGIDPAIIKTAATP